MESYITIAISFIIIIFLIYPFMLYNKLIALRHNVDKNWSNIDVILKQRNSELPKLIAACQQYMKYEKETLQQIVEARSQSIAASKDMNMQALGESEGQMRIGLEKLFALVENYPELKANNSFLQLQDRISSLEETISDRRELYNESVNIFNIRINQIPDMLIAAICRYKNLDLLSFSDEEIKDVDIDKLFS